MDSNDDTIPNNLPQKILDQLSIEELQEAIEQKTKAKVFLAQQTSKFSGPLPPPEILSHYENIHAGFAGRIVAMAEREQTHRHKIERTAVSGSVSAENRGQIYAFIICILVIVGSIWLISEDHGISGSLLAGTTLVGLAYVFITGKRKEENRNPETDEPH